MEVLRHFLAVELCKIIIPADLTDQILTIMPWFEYQMNFEGRADRPCTFVVKR